MTQFAKPAVTVDVVVFTAVEGELKVLLIRRGKEPFAGRWALPGGFIRMDETLETAALRELEQETGVRDVYLEQLYTFGAPDRDPRDRVVTVAYYALIDSTKTATGLTDAGREEQIGAVEWFRVADIVRAPLAFDHCEIIKYALKRLRYKLEYTAVGFELLPERFTLTELQRLYETILGERLDKRNFREKVAAMGIVVPTRGVRRGAHRPARLYRFKGAKPRSAFKRVRFER